MMVACGAGALCLATVALAQAPAKPAAPIKGEAVVASATVTATVAQVDQKTREVTLKADDGKEYSFVAGDAVKNLAQVKKGDVVVATYTEALAWEIKKGGKASAETAVAAGAAQPGARPAGAIAQQTTVTVTVTAIDPKVPSVTFKGPAGKTRTIKVKDPAKLQGVIVGDSVEITYTEALAIKVEKAPKK
jgi:Cu/Ag efflux protein CusF